MLCPVCLEASDGGALDACQCVTSRVHLQCLEKLIARGYDRCGVCCAHYDSRAVVEATRYGADQSRADLGADHAATLRKQLIFGQALVEHGDVCAAAPLLLEIIKVPRVSYRISTQARLLMAKCALAAGAATAAIELTRRLRPSRSFLVHTLIILGDAYLQRGDMVMADEKLTKAVLVAGTTRGHNSVDLLKALQSIGQMFGAAGEWDWKAATQNVIVKVMNKERDPGIRAAAQAELGMTEAFLGRPGARHRLRDALRVLRRRKNDRGAEVLIPRARQSLSKLVKPRRRLRGRHHPEDVECSE